MDIWLIREGEKHGPHPPYHIRDGISSGRYDADTPAWHQGLDAWTTLGEMALYKDEFDPASDFAGGPPGIDSGPAGPDPIDAPPPLPATPPDPASLHLARRFWARWVDLHLYTAIWWWFLWVTHRDVGAIFNNPWILMIQLVPWFAVEAALLHRHGTTPGKWLLGIHVRNADGGALELGQSVKRALRVLVAGIGLGWGLISPICQGVSWWITRRIGRTLWDHLGDHRVEFVPIRRMRYFAVAGVLYLSFQLQFAVLAPHILRHYERDHPKLREYFEKNPPRHLPERVPKSGI